MSLLRIIAMTSSTALVVAAGSARANPMLDSVLQAEQVPGTRHVQLTYIGDEDGGVVTYLRDERPYAVTWQPTPEFAALLGSGVTRTNALQACDCNVPLGRHEFRVVPAVIYVGQRVDRSGAVLEVVANKRDRTGEPIPRPAELPSSDQYLWDEMTADMPRRLQGTNCKAECANVTTLPPGVPPPVAKVERAEVITTGCLIWSGRYIRPPYRLALKELKLTVNGVVVESWISGDTAETMVRAYEEWASSLKANSFEVGSDSGFSRASSSGATAEERATVLAKVDQIVRSRATRAAKLRRLSSDPALHGLFGECAEDVLNRWNGYR